MATETSFRIKEAAEFVGISIDTLRYYEREGILEPVSRNTSGHRRYAQHDLERLGFLTCLRATGMPIRHLKRYAELTKGGLESVPARLELLGAHRTEVQAQVDALARSLETIEGKIARLSKALEEA